MSANLTPYVEARAKKGFWLSHRFGITRRLAQLGFLMFFIGGPLGYHWIAKGTLASSMTLGVLPLTDPLILLQSLAAGHAPEMVGIVGAAIVALFYGVVSGRAYCSWVCPINPVTDIAYWTRERLGLKSKGWQPRAETRLFALAMVIAVAALTGTIAYELVNPITAVFRAIVFGGGFAWGLVLAIFLFDLFAARRGWCGHLCPVGAAYGLMGSGALVKVSAFNRRACDDCMDCFAVCPEPHVISPALRGAPKGVSPVILSRDCTTCGRCVDVCSKDVFRFTHRFDRLETAGEGHLPTVKETGSVS
jgi:ferredoxin-type protein NapH